MSLFHFSNTFFNFPYYLLTQFITNILLLQKHSFCFTILYSFSKSTFQKYHISNFKPIKIHSISLSNFLSFHLLILLPNHTKINLLFNKYNSYILPFMNSKNTQRHILKQIICKKSKTIDEYNFSYQLFLKTSLFSYIDVDRKGFQELIQYIRFEKYKEKEVILRSETNREDVYMLIWGSVYGFDKEDNYGMQRNEQVEIKLDDKKQRLFVKQLKKQYGNLCNIIENEYQIINQERINNRIYIARQDCQFFILDHHYVSNFQNHDTIEKKYRFFKHHYPFLHTLQQKKIIHDLKLFQIQTYSHYHPIHLIDKIYFLAQGHLLVIHSKFHQPKHNLSKSNFQLHKIQKIKISYILEGDLIGVQKYYSKNQFQYQIHSAQAKFYSITYQKIKLLSKQWINFFQYYKNSIIIKQKQQYRLNRQINLLNMQQSFNKTIQPKSKNISKEELQQKNALDKMAYTYSKLKCNWNHIKKIKENPKMNGKSGNQCFKFVNRILKIPKKQDIKEKIHKKSTIVFKLLKEIIKDKGEDIYFQNQRKQNFNIKFNLYNQTIGNF